MPLTLCIGLPEAECGAHLRGGRRAAGLTAAAAGEAAWFGGAKRVAEPGCERSERRILADARSVSARTFGLTGRRRAKRDGNPRAQLLGAPVEPVVGPQLGLHNGSAKQ